MTPNNSCYKFTKKKIKSHKFLVTYFYHIYLIFQHKRQDYLNSKHHNYEKSPQMGIVTKCDILYLCSQNKNKLK